MMGDTVMRCAIQHAVWTIQLDWRRGLPLERCSEIFEDAADLLEHGFDDMPIRFGADRPEYVTLPSSKSWAGATSTPMIRFIEVPET
ncbi:hypothetical protein ACTWPB_14440 [Nocardia sp. IBHARD005]|uniref:hypothetical protein n=1 Tax=Nocardia sp. IBHARD005 TaxID=3457765 RepID=UPI004059AD8E